jgi:hypothetical protein
MGIVLMHKGRAITDDDLAAIRALMSERATWTRRSCSVPLLADPFLTSRPAQA